MTDRDGWNERHAASAGREPGAPSAWVIAHAPLLPRGALVLDIAAGRGRHALALAALGHSVLALDASEPAMGELGRRDARVMATVGDAGALPVRDGAFDAVVCVNFLDRSLFPHAARLLRQGGLLIAETFTIAQRVLGRGPRADAHLLGPGELRDLTAHLRILDYYEGPIHDDAGERFVAAVVARAGAG
ncbi:MAG: class I SAM-dependent methyltransferase [Gemmatimonadaceae bacterium]